MGLKQLAWIVRGFLTDDFGEFDRQDIRKYALENLSQRGIDTGPMTGMDLPTLLAEIETIAGLRERVAA